MNTRKLPILLAASAMLIVAGCDDDVPERPAVVPEYPGASYVFAGRYQGVESTNQFAIWVVDTYTGAVVRCDTQKCGEWVVPEPPASGSEAVEGSLRGQAVQRMGSGR